VQTQIDYEAELNLVVFRSPEAAAAAQRALREAGVKHTLEPLAPGRYQLEDRGLAHNTWAALRGAAAGVVLGAVLGGGAALWLAGAILPIVGGFAAIGVTGGAIIGGLLGAERGADYDDDLGRSIEVEPDTHALLLSTYSSFADRGHRCQARARRDRPVAAWLEDWLDAFEQLAFETLKVRCGFWSLEANRFRPL
jgi:hypothetical protein